MNKYIYMFSGALAILIIVACIAVVNPALAQDFVYTPFFGGGDSGVDAAGSDAVESDAVENDTEVLVAKIAAGEIDIADTNLIPLEPILIPGYVHPPTKPSEQDIEELKEFAKNEPPREEVIVHVGGPKTKGQEILWPKANSRERVQLPPDAWSTGHEMVMCHDDQPDCENGIAIAIKRDSSTLTLWTLNGRVVERGNSTIDPAKKSQLRAEFPEIFAQLDAEVSE